jgi:hypothetical protein
MNTELTQFELVVLDATLKQHAASMGLCGLNLTKLKAVRREPTGVGSYIVLDREGQPPPRSGIDDQLGFAGELDVPGVPSGLGAVVDVESGQLNHIEFFTYGDEIWDGDTSKGTVIPDSPL